MDDIPNLVDFIEELVECYNSGPSLDPEVHADTLLVLHEILCHLKSLEPDSLRETKVRFH